MPSAPPQRIRAAVFLCEIAAWFLSLALVASGRFLPAAACALFALAAHAVGRSWSRSSPGPFPHYLRWLLLLPRPFDSPRRLQRLLRPRSGERFLEVGPGIGVHALPTAASLLPGGFLAVVDVQHAMLRTLLRRAARTMARNIYAQQADAQRLPFADRAFDAAYLVGVLGEIPSPATALVELRRVLEPGGRLVIAELILDPDFVPLASLQETAGVAGFALVRAVGPWFAYCALLRPAAAAPPA